MHYVQKKKKKKKKKRKVGKKKEENKMSWGGGGSALYAVEASGEKMAGNEWKILGQIRSGVFRNIPMTAMTHSVPPIQGPPLAPRSDLLGVQQLSARFLLGGEGKEGFQLSELCCDF